MSINKHETYTLRCDNGNCDESVVFHCEIKVNATLEDIFDAFNASKDYMSGWEMNSLKDKIYCPHCSPGIF